MTAAADELEPALAAAEKIATGNPRFGARVTALEFLETHIFDRLNEKEIEPNSAAINQRGRALQTRLELENAELARALRLQIRAGALRGEELRRALLAQVGPPGPVGKYDALDSLITAVLDPVIAESERVQLGSEMVAFQPTPARAILALVERANITAADLFCDLGAGFGAVPILVSLLTDARSMGIEIEPAYCAAASGIARSVGVERVEFVCADLRAAPLGDATVYFLFTPLRGSLLDALLGRLRVEAQSRPIRVCTLGPCTSVVAQASWLRLAENCALSEADVVVFRSVASPSNDSVSCG